MRRALPALLLLAAACSSSPNLPPEWELGGQTRGYHDGPTVAAGIQATFVPAEALLANWSAATVPGSLASARAGEQALFDALSETGIDDLPGVDLERLAAGLRVTLRGVERAHETVAVMVSRDADASAGLLEAVRALAVSLEAQTLRAPRRTLVLLWGAPRDLAQELAALEEPVAVFVGDALGLSHESTGAVATLVRGVDPGYYAPMPPDRTAAPLDEDGPAPAIAPHGAAIVARLALVDVGIVARPWESREQQWGGERDALSDLGIPSARLTRIPAETPTIEAGLPALDADALRRTSCALLAAGFAAADAGPQDLDRYLKTLAFERRLRVNSAAMEGADHAVIVAWEAWCTGTRHWLRRLCMGLPLDGSGD